jgi:hypothetical protein
MTDEQAVIWKEAVVSYIFNGAFLLFSWRYSATLRKVSVRVLGNVTNIQSEYSQGLVLPMIPRAMPAGA